MLNLIARYFLVLSLVLGFSQSSISACLSNMIDDSPISQSDMEMPGCHSNMDVDDSPEKNWDDCCEKNCHAGSSTIVTALILSESKLRATDYGPPSITGRAQNHPKIPTPPPNA